MNVSVTEDINGQKYVRMEQEPKGLYLSRFKGWQPVQEPKIGHWEWLTEDKYRCSNCNSETRVDECMSEPMYSFCPFCGVKMQEVEE